MLSLDEVVDFFETHFTREAFRLETLDRYDVESDGGDYERYVAGLDGPDMSRLQPFLDELRTESAAGKLRHRVHVLRSPLNDYLRFECEWAYALNVEAGEVIRILDLAETPRPDGLLDEDFWILDGHVLRMIYDADGKVLGGELPDDPEPYYRARDVAIAAATDFRTWWGQHPDEWRRHRAA